MKNTRILIVVVFLLSGMFSAAYAQTGGISPKNDNEKPVVPQERKKGQYDDFELTSENIGWAKEQIKIEKDKAEREFDEGKITAEEYKSRINQIAKAEKKVKEFEDNSSVVNAAKEDETAGGNIDPGTPGEMVSQSDIDKNKKEARLERERQKRELNKQKADAKRTEVALDNIRKARVQLEQEKKDGKVTTKEYNERMERLLQSEKRLKEKKTPVEKPGKIETGKSGKGNDTGKGTIDNKKTTNKGTTQTELNKTQKNNDIKQAVNQGDKKIAEAKQMVQQSTQQLERDRKSGKITEEQYKLKMEKIERVEAAIKDLEKNVEKGKGL